MLILQCCRLPWLRLGLDPKQMQRELLVAVVAVATMLAPRKCEQHRLLAALLVLPSASLHLVPKRYQTQQLDSAVHKSSG